MLASLNGLTSQVTRPAVLQCRLSGIIYKPTAAPGGAEAEPAHRQRLEANVLLLPGMGGWIRRNRLAWPHCRRGLASDGVQYACARSSVGRRFRCVTKLGLEWYGAVFLLLQQRSELGLHTILLLPICYGVFVVSSTGHVRRAALHTYIPIYETMDSSTTHHS